MCRQIAQVVDVASVQRHLDDLLSGHHLAVGAVVRVDEGRAGFDDRDRLGYRTHFKFELHEGDRVHFEDDVGLAHRAKAGMGDGDLVRAGHEIRDGELTPLIRYRFTRGARVGVANLQFGAGHDTSRLIPNRAHHGRGRVLG
jgi:hypothetical protein